MVPVPDEVPLDQAAFGTIGAIAMHGFRQSRAALGETALVIGMGLIGQLLLRILNAAGVRDVAVDLVAERCAYGKGAGASGGAAPPDDPGWRNVRRASTGGHGADVVLISAGGIRQRRDRTRCIGGARPGPSSWFGKTKLDLDYNTFFRKEIEVGFSRSYGPGRYDPAYEIERRGLSVAICALDRAEEYRVLHGTPGEPADRSGAAGRG